MSIMLALTATLTMGLSCLRFGWNSLVSLGLFGTYIYSFPGFIGLTLPFHRTLGERGVYSELSTDTLIGLFSLWAVLLFFKNDKSHLWRAGAICEKFHYV